MGIITPFRAQIAKIRESLIEHQLDIEGLRIDTVERFQGGAKDIILLSCCANHSRQLKAISSVNSEGIDRKLNVAITRAREQFILLGNPDILRESSSYADLLEWIESQELQYNN